MIGDWWERAYGYRRTWTSQHVNVASCLACDGSGRGVPGTGACPLCQGHGVLPATSLLNEATMPQENITIRTLLRDHPKLFYRQEWYKDEPFMDDKAAKWALTGTPPIGSAERSIRCAVSDGARPGTPCADDHCACRTALRRAVDLVALYVRFPGARCWNDYLWTSTLDRQGQRVYVGGMSNGKGFEIHRHLRLTERWGVPIWE